jgi:predicted hydrocarbon binding protein/CheY-like chemotaxis protein
MATEEPLMGGDLVYVVHPELRVANTLRGGLEAADYEVVSMSTVSDAESITTQRQFALPDAILTPLGDVDGGDSILVTLFQSNPLMEQIPLVVVANADQDDRRRALRMGLLSVVFPPYDGEEVVLTTKLAIEKHRSDQLLFGSLAQLSVPDLLQTAEAGRRSGTVTFQHNGTRGTVWLRDGFVIDAEIQGGSHGEEAVYAIAVWATGTFEANFNEVDIEERFRIPPSTLLLEAMRRFDEESASTIPIPALAAAEEAAFDVALVLLNVTASYALNHIHPPLLRQRLEHIRVELIAQHPVLGAFRITEDSAVTFIPPGPGVVDERAIVRAVDALVVTIFERLESVLAWRFSRQRLARLLAPWRDALDEYGFLDLLGVVKAGNGGDDEAQETQGEVPSPVPVGCLVLDGDGLVEIASIYGPRIGRVDAEGLIGKDLAEIFPHELLVLADRLTSEIDGKVAGEYCVAVGREVLRWGHVELVLQMAVVRPVSGRGRIFTLNRLRDQRRSLSPEIVRDPLTGSLRDGRAERLVIANEDFLQAFESLFARSLQHRHHELLQRFGKKWGLRHAMRLEQLVQRDYGMTLREMESQMALELLSSSIGVLGLGRFEADLAYRESGLVVIRHHSSPFPDSFATTVGGACSILSGFHAAVLSYLAGRHLAAREVHCSHEANDPCLFVVATEDRLTKLLIATPGSTDHDLLAEIRAVTSFGGEA